ncbi:MAG TPA: hypothetical protein VGH19_09755 [Verrucomicrobiae bacterium]
MPPRNRSKEHAFTRKEMLCLIIALTFLGMLGLAAIQRGKLHSRQFGCFSRLRSMSLCFKMFAGDNGGLYPFSTTNSIAYQDSSNAWKHFLALSNELGSAKILICPEDVSRRSTTAYAFDAATNGLRQLQNLALSYFLNVDASATNAGMVMMGDRNILINGMALTNTAVTASAATQIQWTADLHRQKGNVVLTDGSVQTLRASVPIGTNQTGNLRLLVP